MRHLIGSSPSFEKPTGDLVEVLRMLTHRLSQPLTSLQGSVEVALLGELNEPECRQTLELSLQESRRMAEILEALRDVLEMEGSGEEASLVSWTQSVKNLLQEATFGGENECLQLVSDLQGEVWVKAVPQQLKRATARLIGQAVKAARGECRVKIGLSAHGETACLSACEEGELPAAGSGSGVCQPRFTPQIMEPGGLDEWIIRHAIEQQGGWYKLNQMSETCRSYQLNLPVAPLKVGRQA